MEQDNKLTIEQRLERLEGCLQKLINGLSKINAGVGKRDIELELSKLGTQLRKDYFPTDLDKIVIREERPVNVANLMRSDQAAVEALRKKLENAQSGRLPLTREEYTLFQNHGMELTRGIHNQLRPVADGGKFYVLIGTAAQLKISGDNAKEFAAMQKAGMQFVDEHPEGLDGTHGVKSPPAKVQPKK